MRRETSITSVLSVLLLAGAVTASPALAAAPAQSAQGGNPGTPKQVANDTRPVLGAAHPEVSDTGNVTSTARGGDEVTGEIYDTRPVLGAAYPGISGAVRDEQLAPAGNRSGNPNDAMAESAESDQAIGYDTRPVMGAAYPGISGATHGEQLALAGNATGAANNAKPGNAETDETLAYDTRSVMGAAYPGISGATRVAQLLSSGANTGSGRPAGKSNVLASAEQGVPGAAAYPGISAGLERNKTPTPGQIASAAAPQPSSAEAGAATPPASGPEIKREAPVAAAGTSQTAMNLGASQSTPAAVPGKQAAHPEQRANGEKVASAAGEPTKAGPAPKTAAGTQVATNEPAKTPSTEANPKAASSTAPSTSAETTKTASAASQKAAATAPATTHATSTMAAPTVEAAQLQKLVGDTVVNRDGEPLGELEKVVVGPQGQIQHVVIRHGGFFGLFANHSEIDWRNAKPQIEGNKLVLALTPEQVASAPAYSGG